MEGMQAAIGAIMVQSSINAIIHERAYKDSRLIEGVKIQDLELIPVPIVFSVN